MQQQQIGQEGPTQWGHHNAPSSSSTEWCADWWCKQRRQQQIGGGGTTNVVKLLRQREQGFRREGSHFVRGSREFYFAMPIRHSQLVVYRPQIFPLRFTPSGDQLIAIGGANQQELLLFAYRGFQYGTTTINNNSNRTGDELFNAIFPRCQTVHLRNVVTAVNAASVGTPGEQQPRLMMPPPQQQQQSLGPLCRECALCTPDSRFLIISAAASVPESKANFRAILRNNESLPPSKDMADITFFCINLNKAQLVDQYKFDSDQMSLSNGVYLSGWTLAILSIQHQTIHMVAIDKRSGHFVPLMQIGHSVFADDALITAGVGGHLINARTERCFTAFRQRLLTFLCKEFQRKGQMQQFLHHFDLFRYIKMRKLQFVGPELLLIRMEQPKSDDDFDEQFASSSFCPPSSSSSSTPSSSSSSSSSFGVDN